MEADQYMTAVERIITDLADRRGLDDAWESIFPGYQTKIRWRWRQIVCDAVVDYAVAVLNEAAVADPQAVGELVEHRVFCNGGLAGHPTIQVGTVGPPRQEQAVIGMVGLVNGILGVVPGSTRGFVAYKTDATGRVVFVRTDRP